MDVSDRRRPGETCWLGQNRYPRRALLDCETICLKDIVISYHCLDKWLVVRDPELKGRAHKTESRESCDGFFWTGPIQSSGG